MSDRTEAEICRAAASLAVFAEKAGIRALTATDDGKIIGRQFGGGQVEIHHSIPEDIRERSVVLAAAALDRKHGSVVGTTASFTGAAWHFGSWGPDGGSVSVSFG